VYGTFRAFGSKVSQVSLHPPSISVTQIGFGQVGNEHIALKSTAPLEHAGLISESISALFSP
jgi:hypothetical protein